MVVDRTFFQHVWVGFVLILTAAFFHIATHESAAAAVIKFNGQPLTFDAPSGYCLVDKSRVQEARALAVVPRFFEPTETMIWMFGECARRDQWFTQTGSGRFGSLFVTKRKAVFAAAQTMTRAAFIAEMVRSDAWRVAYLDVEQRAKSAGFPLRLRDIKLLGRDQAALYIGVTFSAPTKRGMGTIVTVNAMTVVNQLPVNLDISAWRKDASMTALLAEQKKQVRALIARNETSAARPDARTASRDQSFHAVVASE